MRVANAGVVLWIMLLTAVVVCGVVARPTGGDDDRIRVIPKESERRVDIFIDGRPFTSYIWPTTLAKPVLYPLRTATGVIVTRGYPLEPRAGERTDHPHHAGLWFNYGSVNGIDFWNNSDAIKTEDRHKMGTVAQRRIVAAKSGSEQGELEVETDWVSADQVILLKEHTRLAFQGGAKFRSIDRVTSLQAQDQKVVFEDDKEGLMGMRVARALEMPSDKPEIFLDSNGHPTTVAKLDNAGVNGAYLTSEGKTGDAAWGTRGRWCNLSGLVEGQPVTITIFDHPLNPNYPAYWHARGYGLFAVNPLGRKIFTGGKEEALNFTLGPGTSATFRYRVLISSGMVTATETESEYRRFVEAYR
jgi:hypothetical protein